MSQEINLHLKNVAQLLRSLEDTPVLTEAGYDFKKLVQAVKYLLENCPTPEEINT